jgi:hypothetical protein
VILQFLSSLEFFLYSLVWPVLSFVSVLHSDLRPMASLKWQIGSLVCTFAVWLAIVPVVSCAGYLGLNIVSTLPFSQPWAQLHLKWCTAGHHHH